MKLLAKIMNAVPKAFNKFIGSKFKLMLIAKKGKKCRINRNSLITNPEHIYLGNNVNIGPNAVFYCGIAKIIIGDDVMIGPNVTIITGGHRSDILDKPMIQCLSKRPDDDKDVVIKDDVWIGANVTILKGVTIEKGCVIGAGCVVTKDTVPYGIYVGNPNRLIKTRGQK